MPEMFPNVQVLIGDCREKLKEIPSNSVHTCVTSPPYWGLRDYGVEGQIGLEGSVQEFLSVMVEVFREVRRVLRPDGTCWMNLGDTYCTNPGNWRGGEKFLEGSTPHCSAMNKSAAGMGIKPKDLIGIPWRTALALQEDGWYLRSDIIWHKPNPVPEPDRGRPTVAHEYLFLLTKSPRYFYDTDAIREPAGDEPDRETYEAGLGSNTGADSHRWTAGYKKVSHKLVHPDGRNKRTVWTIPTKGFPGAHFATFPHKLVEPCILAGTSEQGCCAECGAPRKRISEYTEEYKAKLGKSWHNHEADQVVGQRGVPSAFRGTAARETKGWESTCGCGADFIPCTVLDPFGGSGTTGEVALQLGRNAILIELNPEYVKFINERTAQMRLGLLG